MKQLVSLFILLYGLPMFSQQKQNRPTVRVYASYQDYTQNKALHEVDMNVKGTHLRAMDYSASYLHDGTRRIKMPLGSIYGFSRGNDFYRYCNRKHAFEHNGFLKVIDNRGIIIYGYSSPSGYRGTQIEHYYYSLGMDTEIKPLRRRHLEADFADSPDVLAKIATLGDVTKNKKGKFALNDLLSE